MNVEFKSLLPPDDPDTAQYNKQLRQSVSTHYHNAAILHWLIKFIQGEYGIGDHEKYGACQYDRTSIFLNAPQM
jgi:hypothetical protein